MECVRERLLRRERQTLSKYAFLTSATRGREHPCEPCKTAPTSSATATG